MDLLLKAVIIGYYCGLSILVLFLLYVRKKTGESSVGTTYGQVPKKFYPLILLGLTGFLVLTLFSIMHIFDPHFHKGFFHLGLTDYPPVRFTGAFFTTIGLLIMSGAVFQLGTSTRLLLPKTETKLITSGMYRISRNPVYLGISISSTGLFLITPNLLTFFSLLFFIVNNHFRIKLEEQFLEKTFTKKYIEYKRKVGRYLWKI